MRDFSLRSEASVALAALLTLSLVGCSDSPEPSYIAPVAIASEDGQLKIAFCEDIDLLRLSISQDDPTSDSGFVMIFQADIDQELKSGDVLVLDDRAETLDPDNQLSDFTTVPGTTYVISASTPRGGGFLGVIENAPTSWSEGLWLPTESLPSTDPCEFWNGL